MDDVNGVTAGRVRANGLVTAAFPGMSDVTAAGEELRGGPNKPLFVRIYWSSRVDELR